MIGLAMIVRDEVDKIESALVRALDVVEHVTILDTGSVDDTLAVAHETLAGCPHSFHRAEWHGFGPARTELLRHARESGSDYTLMLDADHVLHADGDRHALGADAYMLRVRGPMEWRLPLLTRTDHPFTYRGVAHSYLASDEPVRMANTDWLSIDGGPGASREKIERDCALLEQAHADDPSDTRTVFYLAQTYRDLDLHRQAIDTYLRRAEMGGFAEEVYWSLYQAGCLLSGHVSFAQGADVLLKAWRFRPHRVEALRALANAASAVADKYPVPDDVLFVCPGDYGRREAT